MLLTADIGNTNIVLALLDHGDRVVSQRRIPSGEVLPPAAYEDAVMIGDRMDTDMVAGIESGLDTVLVLSGITGRADIKKFPYRPRLVLDGVGDIPGVTE